MLISSPAYKLALPRTHRREFRFNVYTPDGVVLAENVPIGSGSVAAQLQSRVSRTAQFTASDEWFPFLPTDPLSPYHAIVEIRGGLGYPSGESETFPIFKGRVTEATRGHDGEVQFQAEDLASEVVVAGFERPYTSTRGWSTVTEMQRIITDAWPWAEFGPNDVDDSDVPVITWDDDRGKALDDLASSLSARWVANGEGKFQILRYPYFDETPVVTLRDGVDGILSRADYSITADSSYNSIVVISERFDGSVPVKVIQRDVNPTSPTRYGGPFGKRVRTIRVQTPINKARAQQLAASQLSASKAVTRAWRLTSVPDFTLEPGDTIRVQWRGFEDVTVIDSLLYSLSPQEAMTIQTRAATSLEGATAGETPSG